MAGSANCEGAALTPTDDDFLKLYHISNILLRETYAQKIHFSWIFAGG